MYLCFVSGQGIPPVFSLLRRWWVQWSSTDGSALSASAALCAALLKMMWVL